MNPISHQDGNNENTTRDMLNVIDLNQARSKLGSSPTAASTESKLLQVPADEYLKAAIEVIRGHSGATSDSEAAREAIKFTAALVHIVDVSSGRDRLSEKPIYIEMPGKERKVLDLRFDPDRFRPGHVDERIKIYYKPTSGFQRDLDSIISAFSADKREINWLVSYIIQLFAGLLQVRNEGGTFSSDLLRGMLRA